VTGVAHRGVHLGSCSESLVAIRRAEEEVVGGDLHGEQLAQIALAHEGNFLRRTHVQEVYGPAGALDQIEEAAGRPHRTFDVTHIGMLGNRSTRLQGSVALGEPFFVLAVDGDAPAARA
jgi:hypothetical protein